MIPSTENNHNNRLTSSSSQVVSDTMDVQKSSESTAFGEASGNNLQCPERVIKGPVQKANRRFAPYHIREKRKEPENAVLEGQSLKNALFYAGDAEAVRAVFSHAPWLSHTDHARSSLYFATQRNKPDVVGAMLAAGVDPNGTCGVTHVSGSRPLHLAVKLGLTECLQLLLAAGADVNARDTLGWGPLHLAAFHDHSDRIRSLVKSGALVNAASNVGCTPLHTAVQKRCETCVTILLQAGADSKLRDCHGHEPICYAWTNEDFETVREILWYQKNTPSSNIGCAFPKCNHDMKEIAISVRRSNLGDHSLTSAVS